LQKRDEEIFNLKRKIDIQEKVSPIRNSNFCLANIPIKYRFRGPKSLK
jgi:hypothetical protein